MMRLALSALLIALSTPAWAAQCAPRGAILDKLKSKYGETVQSLGLSPRGALVEFFASEETGTWTVLVSHANGMSCIVAAGVSYQAIAPEPAEPDGDDL